ncbi:MAG: hypothetical protein H0X37_21145 [Herpetosiphonaceae bacterium]|nr:hypothetical protein [Herpetosiphonaceae bacterium]
MTPDFVTMSNIIIDDIVLPDGRSFMNTLGGAGTHALIGMRVWSDQLGFAATVGPDWDPRHRRFLESLGIDLRGVVERPGYRTARAWQLFEPDERRIEVFRTKWEDFERYKPQLEDLPADYLWAQGWHLDWGTMSELADLIAYVRQVNPNLKLVWETTPEQLTGQASVVRGILAAVDLFAPDLEEAQALTDETSIDHIIDKLLNWGVAAVALRLGARGSLVATGDGTLYRIPAVPATVVDVTGAGNAYCGGFLVGLGLGDQMADAAARAAVSASFAIEQFGVPAWSAGKRVEAERRFQWTRERIEVASPGSDIGVLLTRFQPQSAQ